MRRLLVVFIGMVFFSTYACEMKNKEVVDENDNALKLAIFGDSLVVGRMSETKMGAALPEDNYLYKSITANAEQATTEEEVSAEEAEKRAVEQLKKLDDFYKQNLENAYSYADKKTCSFSHACRLELDKDQFLNLAVSGSMVSNLDAQLDELASTKGKAERYVIGVGANDFCADTFNKDGYLQGMKGVIDKALAQNAEAKVLVVAIPDVGHLFDVAAKADEIATTVKETQYTCGQIRDGGLGHVYCPRVNNAQDRAAIKAEIKAVNNAVLALVGEYDDSKVKFAESVGTIQFSKEHLAADCFHASAAGLKLLADETWKYQQDFN